jgi:hypothetical protein
MKYGIYSTAIVSKAMPNGQRQFRYAVKIGSTIVEDFSSELLACQYAFLCSKQEKERIHAVS